MIRKAAEMASLEWLREHRELQYLRAAMWERQVGSPRTSPGPAPRDAHVRRRKPQTVNPRFRKKPQPR